MLVLRSMESGYTVKKRLEIFLSPDRISRTKLSLAGNIRIILGQGELVYRHPGWGREIAYLFYSVWSQGFYIMTRARTELSVRSLCPYIYCVKRSSTGQETPRHGYGWAPLTPLIFFSYYPPLTPSSPPTPSTPLSLPLWLWCLPCKRVLSK
jgi:hypothetical protein